MKAFQKWLLTLAATGLAGGVFVTLSHADLAPAWALALPLGVILAGLFLVTLLLQNEVEKFDADERLKVEPPKSRSSAFDTGKERKAHLTRAWRGPATSSGVCK